MDQDGIVDEPLTESEVEGLWVQALRDAKIRKRDSLLLITTAGNARGMAWPRGEIIEMDRSESMLSLEECARANRRRNAYRVSLRLAERHGGGSYIGPEVAAAIMRHELEHHRQFDEDPNLHVAYQACLGAVQGVADQSTHISLYNRIPMEMEANLAAARFVRTLFGDDRIDELSTGSDPLLGQSTSSELEIPSEELMIKRMWSFQDELASMANSAPTA